MVLERCLLALALLAGCKHADPQPGAPSTSPTGGTGGTVAGSSNVVGMNYDVYVNGGHEVVMPYGPDKFAVAALVPKADGQFTVIEGTVAKDGSFTIPNVPAGTYYLRYSNPSIVDGVPFFMVTSERTLDFGERIGGRPDVLPANIKPTPLVIDADGLSPWKEFSDGLSIFSVGARTYSLGIQYAGASSEPHEGETELRGFTTDVSQFDNPTLVDGSKGDSVVITQLVDRVSGHYAYSAVSRAFTPDPFTQADGQQVRISGSFHEAAAVGAVLDFRGTQFAALADQVHPGVQADATIELDADPGAPGREAFGGADLLYGSFDETTNGGNIDEQLMLDFGSPFPADWTMVDAYATYQVEFSPEEKFTGLVGISGPLSMLKDAPIAPGISPPRNLRVQGQPAAMGASGTGLTPTIAWDAPSTGTATVYSVRIWQTDGKDVLYRTNFTTTERSVVVPPGFIQPGAHYFLVVRASNSYDPKRPFRDPLPMAYATTISGPIDP
jgi:hypothetical protein